MSLSLQRSHRWISCLAFVIAVLGVAVAPKFWSGPRPADFPYGTLLIPGTDSCGMQDFACNFNYLRQIWSGSVAHPYRLEDQERLFQAWAPGDSRGFAHGYSPVALVAASPLLIVKVERSFFLWTLINAGLLLALTWGYLLPRVKNPTQGVAIAAILCSYLSLDIFNMGQTAVATTFLCAGAYLLLRDRPTHAPVPLAEDLLLFVALYLLAAKPSVALIGFALAVSQRAWRPLLLVMLGLLVTWAVLAPHYGGYIEGLKDYNRLLNHYCNADMPPLFHAGISPSISTNFTSFVTTFDPAWNRNAFFLSGLIFKSLVIGLTFLGWSKRICLSVQFQGLIWTFLLFCPYLLVTEDFAICLLATEGTFFRNGSGATIKVLLVFLLANVWVGALLHWPLTFTCKLVLAIWWLGELVAEKNKMPTRAA